MGIAHDLRQLGDAGRPAGSRLPWPPPPMIREWRAQLLRVGVSVSMAAKAYRLLHSILATAVEEDKILARNPCRVRAGTERAPERPFLTVAQVFELAELVGCRPIGNIRRLADGQYRLRYRRYGTMRTAPEVYLIRRTAERALWAMGNDGRADYDRDRRYRALVLLATFASLRWGEATALRRCDLDMATGCSPRALGLRGAVNWRIGDRPTEVESRPSPRRHSLHQSFQPCASISPSSSAQRPKRSSFPESRAVRYGAVTSTRCRPGHTPSGRSAPKASTFTISRHTGNHFAGASGARASRI